MSARDDESESGDLGLDGFRRQPTEQGLSLDQLSEAFAEMLSSGDDPYAEPDDPSAFDADPREANDDDETAGFDVADGPRDDDPCELTPRSIVEAVLFVGRPDNVPLTSSEIAARMRGVRPEEIDEAVRELNARYRANGCPYHVVSDGAGYRLTLTEEYGYVRNRFQGRLREARLSQAAIDVLAIVAYNQPLSADDVTQLRGTPSSALLSQLVRRQLLRLERPEDNPRRPLFLTTPRFLELFGLSSLEDLPRHEGKDEAKGRGTKDEG